MKMHRSFVVLLCITFSCCLHGGRTRSCSKQLGKDSVHHPKTVQGDSAPVVCVSNRTCCTRQLEETLQKQVVLDMKKGMSKKYDEVKESVMTIHEDLKAYFLETIERSYTRTVDWLSKSHKNLTHSTKPLLRQLFKDMEAFIADSSVDLNSSVGLFFQGSFPLLYPMLDPSEKPLSDGYKMCLKKNVGVIKPFGDKPEELVKTLIEMLSPVQIFLGGLVVSANVITTARDFSFADGCDVEMLKMKYCPLCQGMNDIKPCHRFCLDLMEACMTSEMQLRDDWNDYIKSLVSLAGALSKSDLPDFTSEMYKYLLNSASVVLTSKETLLPKVVKECGKPTYKTAGSSSPGPVISEPAHQSHTTTIISMKMEGVKPKVDFFTDLFVDLPRGICEDDQWAASHTEVDLCWNGEAKARYTGLKTRGTLQPSTDNTDKLKGLIATIKEAVKLIKTSTLILQGGDEDGDASGSGIDGNEISGSGECGDGDDCGSTSGVEGDNTIDDRTRKGEGNNGDIYLIPSTTHPPKHVGEGGGRVPPKGPDVNSDEPQGGKWSLSSRCTSWQSITAAAALVVVLLLD